MPLPNLTGQVFGRLTVLGRAPSRDGARMWRCLCTCGREAMARSGNLTGGQTGSCGCLKTENVRTLHLKHGAARGKGQVTPEYRIWVGMIVRCYNPKATSYPRYGGRGITVCDRWRESFQAFLADMGPRPTPQHSIDRKRNDGPYEPGNCRLLQAVREHRYYPDRHVDVLDVMTGHGAAARYSLTALALAYGLITPAEAARRDDGAQVAELVRAGETTRVVKHALEDVRLTAALYRRWVGVLEREGERATA